MKSHTSILVSVNLTKGGMPVFFFNYFVILIYFYFLIVLGSYGILVA